MGDHRWRLRALGAAVAMVAVAGAPGVAMAFNPQPDPPADADLLGRVTDACTARPIGDVHLALTPTSGEGVPPTGDRTVAVTTDGGHYLFRGLAPGDYSLRVSPTEGYGTPLSATEGSESRSPPPAGSPTSTCPWCPPCSQGRVERAGSPSPRARHGAGAAVHLGSRRSAPSAATLPASSMDLQVRSVVGSSVGNG
jgi:hypothetical protein